MNEEILSRVVESVSTTTRYRQQLLTAEADLEIDLGIEIRQRRIDIIVKGARAHALKNMRVLWTQVSNSDWVQ